MEHNIEFNRELCLLTYQGRDKVWGFKPNRLITVFGIQYVGSIGKMLSYDINDNAARPNKV